MDIEDFLTASLEAFCVAHELPTDSDAEDLLTYHGLVEAERQWLAMFCALWEEFGL